MFHMVRIELHVNISKTIGPVYFNSVEVCQSMDKTKEFKPFISPIEM
jgi:hypothetical protein